MNWLLGLNKVWDALEGSKTYLAGGASVLTGLAGLLNELIPLIQHRNALEAWGFVKDLPQDQSWLMILSGLAVMGLRHSHQKLSDELVGKP